MHQRHAHLHAGIHTVDQKKMVILYVAYNRVGKG